MPLTRDIPGAETFELDHLLLDVNGTLANRARLIDGVADRIARARQQVEVHLLSADTLGNLDEIATRLGVDAQWVRTGAEKREYAKRLGADRCAAIGNGLNDVPMLETVRFGIAVIGPEGAGGRTLVAADAVCASILDAFDLLLEADTTSSTLRP
ncbi:MAG TPA: HAD family hydrolase [Solirubrobacterales bacterium]|nr:HAD family hydrolase [Solirubrobacterales bacterium]